jgi:3D (Asp-Asp-Asp) domain-containing protein
MKSFFGGSAVIAATLLLSSLLFSASPSAAETPLPSAKQQKQISQPLGSEIATAAGSVEKAPNSNPVTAVVPEATDPAGAVGNNAGPAAAPTHFTATAYSLYGKTASGRRVSKGLIAADPRVLPLGTRVRVEAGAYSGEYLVADTGGAVRGKRIDIWTPTGHEAMRFGRRLVKLTVLSYGPHRSAARRQRSR